MGFERYRATDDERRRTMSGDADVPHPNYETTLAITVRARPEHIWPWLVQMGYQRGGLYSYDWLDRVFGYLDRPSATTILPEHQTLKAGDVIPIGRGGNFPVRAVVPQRSLVLGGVEEHFAWIWELGLFPAGDAETRLVSRNRARVPAAAGWRVFMKILAPAAFIMTRRMLVGVKERAERLAAARGLSS